MAPPNSSNFSVKVVLPASGCEMMAKVRRGASVGFASIRSAGAVDELVRSAFPLCRWQGKDVPLRAPL